MCSSGRASIWGDARGVKTLLREGRLRAVVGGPSMLRRYDLNLLPFALISGSVIGFSAALLARAFL
jgi:hypothetical protein